MRVESRACFQSIVVQGVLAVASLAPLVYPAAGARADQPAPPPNVLVILVDDAGYGDYSCHGNPVVKTPNIDRLHEESIRLSDFHVAPMCTPTRSQLMTGMDCLRNGASAVWTSRMLLRAEIPTAADIFAAGGYRTGQFGKWHLGDNYPYRPQDRGFQDVVYFHLANIGMGGDYWCNDYFDPWLRRDDGKPVQFQGYSTDILFDEAMHWMGTAQGKPFFCYLPLDLVHNPLLVPQQYRDRYRDQKPEVASFFGMVAKVDENMGRLDAFLRTTDLVANTIVIFLNDNGGTVGVPIWNAGMRGSKMEYYEGGHRSPCFIRWPAGKLRPPGDVGGLTEVQDILPTLVDLCGLKKTRVAKFDGVSLASMLRGQSNEPPDRTLVVSYRHPGRPLTKEQSAVMWRRWRLVGYEELYDLATDFAQEKNVIAEHPKTAARLRAAYDQWWRGVEPHYRVRSAIVVGDEHENPTTLTPAARFDQANPVSQAIRLATSPIEPWLVEIARPGEYEIVLRRWPEEAATAITAGVPPWQSQDTGSGFELPAGKALPIRRASLRIGDFAQQKVVGDTDKSVAFHVALKPGRTMLHATFLDADGKELCAAYFVSVRLSRPAM
jgi:arylsulfatase